MANKFLIKPLALCLLVVRVAAFSSCSHISSRSTLLSRPAPLGSTRNEIDISEDDFLKFLGYFYATTGAAHTVDFATSNSLLSGAGLPPFGSLPLAARVACIIWCCVGVVQPLVTERRQRQALALAYPACEIGLAVATTAMSIDLGGHTRWLAAAAGAQVGLWYLYQACLPKRKTD